ncbi:hypothetical protein CJ030_MR1G018399 [Morella rubra]|uniref:PB1-like domain-containing protein n=1 Tax=Morella rubra TaxID=262757 RepID=A0A6A1WT68_9ROSI|nr:hypothetical protein CJ030_MR1G018399 [Morella rubra]
MSEVSGDILEAGAYIFDVDSYKRECNQVLGLAVLMLSKGSSLAINDLAEGRKPMATKLVNIGVQGGERMQRSNRRECPALVRIACVVLPKQEICTCCGLVSASGHKKSLTSGLKTSEHSSKFSLCTKDYDHEHHQVLAEEERKGQCQNRTGWVWNPSAQIKLLVSSVSWFAGVSGSPHAGGLKIVIYHGGTFLGGRGQLYVGGSADVVGNMDPDFISLEEIRSTVNGLGYVESGDLWYTFDDEEWVAVKTFKSDRDVINMINRSRAEKRKVLNIFVEHVIDEAELLQLDSPLAELEGIRKTAGFSFCFLVGSKL